MEKIILGYWDNEPIWRWPTAEEALVAQGGSPELARLYVALNEKQEKTELKDHGCEDPNCKTV